MAELSVVCFSVAIGSSPSCSACSTSQLLYYAPASPTARAGQGRGSPVTNAAPKVFGPGGCSVFLVEMGESRTPRPRDTKRGCTTGLSGALSTRPKRPPADSPEASRGVLGGPQRYRAPQHPDCISPPAAAGSGDRDVTTIGYAARASSRSPVTFSPPFYRVGGELGLQSCPADPLSKPRIPLRVIEQVYHIRGRDALRRILQERFGILVYELPHRYC